MTDSRRSRHKGSVRRIVLLCVVLAACDDHGKSPCSGTKTVDVDIPAEAQLQFKIDRCRADANTCNDVCTAVMLRDMLGGVLTRCNVSVPSDTVARVKLSYGCGSEFDGGVVGGPDGSIIVIDAATTIDAP